MYAYLDESGHSGSNLFDPSQRHFYACAVISSMDLDSRYSVKFNEYAQQQGQPHLHAAEMGVGRLLDLLPRLQKDIKRDTVRFFIVRGRGVVIRHRTLESFLSFSLVVTADGEWLE
jgi:hypothetical protein